MIKKSITALFMFVCVASWAQKITKADWPEKLRVLDCDRDAVPFVANEADTTYALPSPGLYALLMNTANAALSITDSAGLQSVAYAFAHNKPENVSAFVAGVSMKKNGQACISICDTATNVYAVRWFRWDEHWVVYLRVGCRNPCFVFEPFVPDTTPKGGVPDCKPDTCVLFESYNNYHVKTDTIRDTIEEKLNLRPFVEQSFAVEVGKFSYTNGRYDLPTYVGLWILKPKKNFQLNAAIGVRGRGQQRFGQLKARDCDCDDGTPVFSFRTQGAYNFWSSSNKSFFQVGIQYEKVLSGARLEREYPGLDLSKNWRPYGTTALSFNVGHDWHIYDKLFGGSVLRAKIGTTLDYKHGAAIQASVAMIFIGKKELPKKEAPDAVERKINQGTQWVAQIPSRIKEKRAEEKVKRDSLQFEDDKKLVAEFLRNENLFMTLGLDLSVVVPDSVNFKAKKLFFIKYKSGEEKLYNAEREVAKSLSKIQMMVFAQGKSRQNIEDLVTELRRLNNLLDRAKSLRQKHS